MTEATNTRRDALEDAAQEAERIGSAWAEDTDCPKTSRAVGRRIAETIRSLKGGANTPAGMKAWSGGAKAPADWDGGPVLLRNGYMGEANHWGRNTPAELGYEGDNDIVAYTPQTSDCSGPGSWAPAEQLEWLAAIREVVREAHSALDDSEDRSHEDEPIHAVPHSNAIALEEALVACENFAKPDEEWDGPGPLVTRVIECVVAQSDALTAANARIAELEGARQTLSDALTKHHQWHAAQTTPDPEYGFVPADEYADSGLYDETVAALGKASSTILGCNSAALRAKGGAE